MATLVSLLMYLMKERQGLMITLLPNPLPNMFPHLHLSHHLHLLSINQHLLSTNLLPFLLSTNPLPSLLLFIPLQLPLPLLLPNKTLEQPDGTHLDKFSLP